MRTGSDWKLGQGESKKTWGAENVFLFQTRTVLAEKRTEEKAGKKGGDEQRGTGPKGDALSITSKGKRMGTEISLERRIGQEESQGKKSKTHTTRQAFKTKRKIRNKQIPTPMGETRLYIRKLEGAGWLNDWKGKILLLLSGGSSIEGGSWEPRSPDLLVSSEGLTSRPSSNSYARWAQGE